MPHTKMTWSAFREHLRKMWMVYLIGIAVCLGAVELLWTVTEPQIPDDRTVLIYLADSSSNPEALKDVAEKMLEETRKQDPSLQKVEFQSLQYADPELDYTGPMILMARLTGGDSDAFLANRFAMEDLVSGGALLPLDEFVTEGWMEAYGLEPYYASRENENGEKSTFLAGLKLDSLHALSEREAFREEGAFLAVFANGTNQAATLYALEVMVGVLSAEGAQEAVPASAASG